MGGERPRRQRDRGGRLGRGQAPGRRRARGPGRACRCGSQPLRGPPLAARVQRAGGIPAARAGAVGGSLPGGRLELRPPARSGKERGMGRGGARKAVGGGAALGARPAPGARGGRLPGDRLGGLRTGARLGSAADARALTGAAGGMAQRRRAGGRHEIRQPRPAAGADGRRRTAHRERPRSPHSGCRRRLRTGRAGT